MLDFKNLQQRADEQYQYAYELAEKFIQGIFDRFDSNLDDTDCAHFSLINNAMPNYREIIFGNNAPDMFEEAEYEVRLDCDGELTFTIDTCDAETPVTKVLNDVLVKNGFTYEDTNNSFSLNVYKK